MFKYFLVSAAMLLTLSSCTSTQKQNEGFAALFNGKDLSGWMIKKVPEDHDNRYWYVEDGAIVANSMGDSTHNYVWLLTEKEYSDFILKLKFQAYRDSPGNSGVQVLSRYDDEEGWLNGPQIDINPPGPWRTGMMWDETRGNQRFLFPNLPQGEWVDESMVLNESPFYFSDDAPAWNEIEIKVENHRIEAWLNGVKITDFQGKGILDDELHQQKNVGTKGHIALQIHTGDQLEMRYKDIEIKVLGS